MPLNNACKQCLRLETYLKTTWEAQIAKWNVLLRPQNRRLAGENSRPEQTRRLAGLRLAWKGAAAFSENKGGQGSSCLVKACWPGDGFRFYCASRCLWPLLSVCTDKPFQSEDGKRFVGVYPSTSTNRSVEAMTLAIMVKRFTHHINWWALWSSYRLPPKQSLTIEGLIGKLKGIDRYAEGCL